MDDGEDISLILVRRDHSNPDVDALVKRAQAMNIRVTEGSENDLWRMARDNADGAPDVLALVGREPSATFEEGISPLMILVNSVSSAMEVRGWAAP